MDGVSGKKLDFGRIEKKWQKRWADEGVFEAKDGKGKKFYCLEQFPYPSGSGLHMGHAFIYTIGDIYARFKRMSGFNVLYPMGFDSFGLPAENAAIKAKSHPKKFTEEAIKNFIAHFKRFGNSYDWSRMVETHKPEFYKWDQWIFLKMFEKGLAYRKKAPVNWCSKCNTVLANEQVVNGKCWRHEDTEVAVKNLEQWFLKITDYADELYEDIDSKLNDWPPVIKTMQKNWIGKSNGTEVLFEIPYSKKTNFVLLHGYTGRPDANFFPWLKKELEDRGYDVQVPELPNPDRPNVEEQVDYVLENCKFDENTVLLGHSLGGAVAIKVTEMLKKPIKKLVLAAGFVEPNSKDKSYVKTFDWKFNFDKIKKNSGEIIILRDENDKEIRKDSGKKIQEAIGGKLISFEAEDEHICAEEEPVVLNYCLDKWPVFTTRVDTLFGVTFLVVSAQHSRLMELVSDEQKKDVEKFLKKVKSTKEEDMDKLDKEGVFTGSYAVNPLTGEKVPIWAGNFVVAEYGSGMVMAVPAHDQRDFEFAKKYDIPIKEVVTSEDGGAVTNDGAFTDYGVLVNSGAFDGLKSREAIEHIANALEMKKLGKKTVNFRLRDWLISRQRFWGTPIPIVYCEKCGAVPVPEKDLPVKLPDDVTFSDVKNPLVDHKKFTDVKCPSCGSGAKRETDTMDTFVNSSWYFLRYCDSGNGGKIFDKKKADYWMPIDIYIGGKEHAVMHDIYFRFYTKFLRDIGLLNFDEPAVNLFNQGFVYGDDGRKMSKSYGNVVLPDDAADKYGVDATRMFLVSVASPQKDFNWNDRGAESTSRFIRKVVDYFEKVRIGKSSKKVGHRVNKAIKEISKDVDGFDYNFAVIKLRSLFDGLEQEVAKKDLESFVKMLSVFCPFVAEELWEKLGGNGFVSVATWPIADEKKIDEAIDKADEAIDKTVGDIMNILKIVGEKGGGAGAVYIYALPNEVENYKADEIGGRVGREVKVFAVNDKKKYDPEGKSKKAKPGKPAIFVE